MRGLTVFLAEDKDEVGGAVFEVRIQVSHEADQPTLHRGAFLRSVGRVSQRRQDLKTGGGVRVSHLPKILVYNRGPRALCLQLRVS